MMDRFLKRPAQGPTVSPSNNKKPKPSDKKGSKSAAFRAKEFDKHLRTRLPILVVKLSSLGVKLSRLAAKLSHLVDNLSTMAAKSYYFMENYHLLLSNFTFECKTVTFRCLFVIPGIKL